MLWIWIPRGILRQRQRVADLEGRVGPAHDGLPDRQALGGQDVALLPVLVDDQGDEGAAVRDRTRWR